MPLHPHTRSPAALDIDEEPAVDVTPTEEREIEEQAEPRLPVIYEIVRRRGGHELNRPVTSLWWSGLAAGLSIGLSVLGQALIASYLPDTDWSPVVEKLGYSFGFVLVIMAGQQLFTENTLTAVAPVLARPGLANFLLLSRLWSVVLVANLVGASCFAWFAGLPSVLPAGVADEITLISRHALDKTPTALLLRGIAAGFLIASLVWILARAQGDRVLLIVLITWIVALGDFAHVIAGSVEAAWLVLAGERSAVEAGVGFVLPTLAGNVVGGTVLFAVLAYAQIVEEMKEAPRSG
ncbi:MAG: formate/nitrite transporter family protein [Lautropia sp.]